jgi:hypothetical protein
MSILVAAILAISANPSESAPASTAQAPTTPAVQASAPASRSGRELSEAAHAALRRWAKASEQDAAAAARELLGIYQEIQSDTRMSRSERETLRLTVRSRLDRLSTLISKQIAKEKSDAKATSVKSVAANPNQPRAAVLAGVGVAPGGGAGFGGGANGAGGQNAKDDGQLLVDLIQSTISPKSWDVNGGACTIYYWQPQHAIVVHATGDVHDSIADTLEQLNRASH